MSINDKEIIDNDGLPAIIEKYIKLPLAKGYHKIEVEFFQAGGGDGLNMSWKNPGIEKQIIGEEYYYNK